MKKKYVLSFVVNYLPWLCFVAALTLQNDVIGKSHFTNTMQ